MRRRVVYLKVHAVNMKKNAYFQTLNRTINEHYAVKAHHISANCFLHCTKILPSDAEG